MKSVHSISEESVGSAGKLVLPVRDDTLTGDIPEGNGYQCPERKLYAEMSFPLSQSQYSEASKSPSTQVLCQQPISKPETSTKRSLVKYNGIPRSLWLNKLFLSLLGFCLPIGCIPECDQGYKPIMVCLPGPPEMDDKKEKEEDEIKPVGLITRNKEADFIGGKFIAGCTCGRKNGLQGDCPRISCRNNPGCYMNPPRCWPQFKQKVKPVPPPDQKMVCVPIQLVYYDPTNI